jgi:hypothetical protein
MYDTTISAKSPTIEELFASGRLSISPSYNPAVVSYVYLDGQCVGTMWVELDRDVEVGSFENCFDPHHKHPETLAKVVGAGNCSAAEHALAKKVVSLAKEQTS